MKYLLSIILAISIAVAVIFSPVLSTAAAASQDPASNDSDLAAVLSTLTFDELVEIRSMVTQAIFASDGWQQVTVPGGHYIVGQDIPAGRWVISTSGNYDNTYILHFDTLNEDGTDMDYLSSYESQTIQSPGMASEYIASAPSFWTFDLRDGWYLWISDDVIFTPDAGPAFTFK